MKNRHPVFAASSDAHVLYAHLKSAAAERPKEVVTYDELASAIGRDVRAGARPVLITARRMALREDNLLFETVRGVGVRLVTGEEVYKVATAARRAAGRAARRGLQKVSATDLGALDPEIRARTIAEITVLEFQARAAHPKMIERLQGKVREDQPRLPSADVLELFK